MTLSAASTNFQPSEAAFDYAKKVADAQIEKCNLVAKVLAWDLEVFNNNRNTLSIWDVSLILAKKNDICF